MLIPLNKKLDDQPCSLMPGKLNILASFVMIQELKVVRF